ncbi:MAG: hypothetical protein PVG70_16565 [Desulfobacterales bacterium]|jgi:3D (Asp-Asp-Asp) domain-containing protein
MPLIPLLIFFGGASHSFQEGIIDLAKNAKSKGHLASESSQSHLKSDGEIRTEPDHQAVAIDRLWYQAMIRPDSNAVSTFFNRNHTNSNTIRLSNRPLGDGTGRIREVTAYNVGDSAQTFGDPCQAANGENICAALDSGFKRCAANFVPFGTKLHIEKIGVCTVTDRMNKRYGERVDIAMKKNEKARALRFGLKHLKVKIVGN